jgi:hypothetical protein
MNALDVNSDELKKWGEGKMSRQGLPTPSKPKGKDPEFEYPEDPSKLQSIEVGQWMSRFTGYFNYATSLLGRVASELVLIEAEYRLKVNTLRGEVLDDLPSRPAADVVESEVLKRNDELAPIYERRLKLLSIEKTLEARAKTYERGYQAMSRELARREMEGKIQ